MIHLTTNFYPAPVFLDNTRGDGKSKSRAAGLRGEEWIEKHLLMFGRDAFASVFDFEDNGAPARIQLGRTGVERDPATLTDALGGIANKINEDLFDLMRVGKDFRLYHLAEGDFDG